MLCDSYHSDNKLDLKSLMDLNLKEYYNYLKIDKAMENRVL